MPISCDPWHAFSRVALHALRPFVSWEKLGNSRPIPAVPTAVVEGTCYFLMRLPRHSIGRGLAEVAMDTADDDVATPAAMDVPVEDIQRPQAIHDGNY
jgi:hypothetical protein